MNGKFWSALIAVSASGLVWAGPLSALETQFAIKGFRQDRIDFNLANTDGHPNVLSELQFKDLNIQELGGTVKTSGQKIYARGSFHYGFITSGENQDSDYLGDNRTDEFSRSSSESGGHTLDGSAGVGFPIHLQEDFSVVPLVGYAFNKQYIEITDGVQTLTSPFAPPLGPFSNLDSSYSARWQGPWLGFDIAKAFGKKFSINGGFEYHWIDYRGVTDWNLRTDLQHPESSVQTASGSGVVGTLGGQWLFAENWSLGVIGKLSRFAAHDGEITIFGVDETARTSLNDARWKSASISVAIARRF